MLASSRDEAGRRGEVLSALQQPEFFYVKNHTSLVEIVWIMEGVSDYNCESVGGRHLDVCPVLVIAALTALVEGS